MLKPHHLHELIGSGRLRVLGCDSTSRLQKSIEWLQSWQLRAALAQRLYDFLRGNVPNQDILREWTAAESAECSVEAAATSVIRGQHFFSSLIRTAMQMNSNVKVAVLIEHRANEIADLLGRRETNSIGQGDHVQIFGLEEIQSVDDFVNAPGIAVGISKSHRDVDNDAKPGIVRFFLNLLEFIEGLFGGLVLILTKECFRDRIGKSYGGYGLGVDCALHAFFIHHDPDDFDVVGWIEFLEHCFGIRHLRHCFCGDERDGIDVFETGTDESVEVFRLQVSGDDSLQALPSIPRAFDKFDRGAHVCSTPTLNSPTSGFNAAASSAWVMASRVSIGSMILSIHRRAAPYRGSVCSS